MRPFRNELKYSIHYNTRELLLTYWQRYLVRAPFTNEHAVSPILSQYYDSPQLTFADEKYEGLNLRNKVRIRVYAQQFLEGDTATLEIKRRHNDLVRKERYKITDFKPRYHLRPENWTFNDSNIQGAFLSLRERHRLRASAQTYYQREAYEGAVEKDIRITFDTNLIGLYPGEKLTKKLLMAVKLTSLSDSLACVIKARSASTPTCFSSLRIEVCILFLIFTHETGAGTNNGS